ncbi:fimbrial protein [Serratia silvae]|uniref:Fimbrial protein n=1 Tax=Serratia silvae TaxID=2824122 RepID=A0ABT0KGZ1_9GAMM|nr:fimbrial protein [Serratia silvae]MCL1031289.1 fimbrial protein [Serratia silvae]
MHKTWAIQGLLRAGLLLIPIAVQAQVNVTFRGTLIAPPQCTINDGGQVDVAFSDQIGINSVDGVNHRKKVNYQISCDKGTNDYSMLTLTLNGNAAVFDEQVLKTTKDNLGIKIYQSNRPFLPGSTLTIVKGYPPLLEAVLVKKSNSVLTEGPFEAWATLRADYQ